MLFIIISAFIPAFSPTFLSKLALHVLKEFLHVPSMLYDHKFKVRFLVLHA